MNTTTLAMKDFRDARRSKILWGVVVVFTVFVVGTVLTGPTEGEAVETAMSTIVGIGTFVLPLAVIVITYLSITGERESGRIRYLLSLPVTRLEVVGGKFLGRAMVSVVAILIAFVAGAGSILVHIGTMPGTLYLQFVLFAVLYTVAWVGISVGVSAMSATRGKALTGSLGFYFTFVVFYTVIQIQDAVSFLVEDVAGLAPIPELYDLGLAISPAFAFSYVTNVLARGVDASGASFVGDYGDSLPFFLQAEFSIVVLLLWLAVPLVVGYLQFRRAEIG